MCSRILYTTHLNHKNGSAGIHLNNVRFEREKGKKERYKIRNRGVKIYGRNIQYKKTGYNVIQVFHREIFKENNK